MSCTYGFKSSISVWLAVVRSSSVIKCLSLIIFLDRRCLFINTLKLFSKELFVPIICVTDYEEFDEAIRLCNESQYGLTAGIYSNKEEEINWFLDDIECGVVYVNRSIGATTGAMVGCQSFGGWKDSGTTGKGTGGPYYLMQFMREQSQTFVD